MAKNKPGTREGSKSPLRGEPLFSVTKKDLDIVHFRAGGKGGQGQNKVNSGSRVTHRASGAVGEARDSRDQPVNTRNAFIRMTKTKEFQQWLKLEGMRASGLMAKIEADVDASMTESNIKVEVYDERRGDFRDERERSPRGQDEAL